MSKKYKVATFAHWEDYNRPRKRPLVTAYLKIYNEQWKGCIIYEISAENGREAKKAAIKARRTLEDHKASLDHKDAP